MRRGTIYDGEIYQGGSFEKSMKTSPRKWLSVALALVMVCSLLVSMPLSTSALSPSSKPNPAWAAPNAGGTDGFDWNAEWENIHISLNNYGYDAAIDQLNWSMPSYPALIKRNGESLWPDVTLDYGYTAFTSYYDEYFIYSDFYYLLFISANQDSMGFGNCVVDSTINGTFNLGGASIAWGRYEPHQSSNGKYGYVLALLIGQDRQPIKWFTMVYDPGEHGTWTAAEETYIGGDPGYGYYNTYYGAYAPSFGTKSGKFFLDDHDPGYEFDGFVDQYERPYNKDYFPLVEMYSDMILTAQWKVIDYSIVYELNGGMNDPANPYSYTVEDGAITLKAPTKHGYTFAGWAEGDDVIPAGSWGDKTFTAVWWPDTYNIDYHLNGGTNSPGNPDTYTIEDTPIILADPVRDGYTFLGWEEGDTIEGGSVGNRVFTASWIEDVVDPIYSAVTVSNSYASYSGEGVYVEDYHVTINAGNRNGYTFDGWTVATGGVDLDDPAEATTTFTMPAYAVAFSAQWKLIEYPITYVLKGGEQNPGNPVTYTIESGVITLLEPLEREGYSFIGWFDSSDAQVTAIPEGSFGEVVLYAKWAPIETEITTYAVEITDSYASESGAGNYPVNETVTINAGSRSGYTFTGWTINGGDITLENAGSITTSFIMPEGGVALTATWRRNGGGNGGSIPTTAETPDSPEVTETTETNDPTDDPEEEETADLTGENGQTGRTETVEVSEEPEPLAEQDFSQSRPNATSGNALEASGPGRYFEIDDNGSPLGEWRWDEEAEEWIYEAYTPLANMPKTGDSSGNTAVYLLVMLGVSLAGIGFWPRKRGKQVI